MVEENGANRQVIEPEVLEHLPSVRKLAELYKQEGSSEITITNNSVVSVLVSSDEIKVYLRLSALAF